MIKLKKTGNNLPTKRLAALAFLTVLSVLIGLIVKQQFVLPFLNGSVLTYFLVTDLFNGKRRNAILSITLWGIVLITTISIATIFFPGASRSSIIDSKIYEKEMLLNINYDKSSEALDPKVFIIRQNRPLFIYLFLSLLSAGTISSFYAAYLLNFMGYYIGTLFIKSNGNAIAWSMGFHPWSTLRSISFIFLGVITAEIGLSFYLKRPIKLQGTAKFWLLSIITLLMDMLSKTYLGPLWFESIRSLIK